MNVSAYRKAIVAVLTAGLSVLAIWQPWADTVTVQEIDTVATIALMVLNPLLVYLVPNRS